MGEPVPSRLNHLVTDMDARRWTKEFMVVAKDLNFVVDEELMFTWFCNSIMCGYDNGRWETEKRFNKALKAVIVANGYMEGINE